MKKMIKINGMTCTSCALSIEKVLKKDHAIKDISVNFASSKMSIEYDEKKIDMPKIAKIIDSVGYQAVIEEKSSTNKDNSVVDEYIKMKKRLFLSLLFTIPVFYLAMGHMINLPIPMFLHGEKNILIMALVQLFLTIPVLLLGKSFYIKGFKSLIKRSPNMDSLIAVGTSAAFIYGVFVVFMLAYGYSHNDLSIVSLYSNDLYFESAAVILTLITLGKFLEAKAKGKTSDAIAKLMQLAPTQAVIFKDGKEMTINTADIVIGDIVVVKPGNRIPVDGKIIKGYSSVDESMLTGESIPIEKTLNHQVITGSINMTGSFSYEVTAVGKDTILSKIISLVEQAQGTKAPIAKLADKISEYFVPTVMLASLLSFVIWLIAGYEFNFAFRIAISVLVISCPCALGLATPTAIMVGTGISAKNGILIKTGEALERMNKIDTVVFDKTGTITVGKPEVTDLLLFDDEKTLLTYVYAAESMSEHPLSSALVSYCQNNDIVLTSAEKFEAKVGSGLVATVDKMDIQIGNEKLMNEYHIDLQKYKKEIDLFASQGKTPLLVAYSSQLKGIIAVADTIKENSKSTIKRLKNMGMEVILLTGDNQLTAAAIGKQVGITNVISEVLPEHKSDVISRLQNDHKQVMMVGDGINDAIALTKADVGVAIGNGTDVAIEAADVVLMRDDIKEVVNAISLSRATLRTIKQNLFWAFFYNVIGIPVAAGILFIPLGITLNPMIAAAAMSFSSVSVVLNALRLKTVKLDKYEKKQITKGKGEVNSMEKTIKISGMTCMHCVKNVTDTLLSIKHIEKVDVSLESNSATISYEGKLNEKKIVKAIKEAGYEVTEIG